MMDKRTKKLKAIIDFYGKENQIVKTFEELGELSQVLSKTLTQSDSVAKVSITTEIADVQIMLEQLKIIFDCKKEVDMWVDMKIQRQIERMAKE